MSWWYKRDLRRTRLKEKCLDRQGGICLYCGKKLTLEEATLDRVVPHDMGGTYSDDNTVVAHVRCNQIKANRIHLGYWRKLKHCHWLNQERIIQACQRINSEYSLSQI